MRGPSFRAIFPGSQRNVLILEVLTVGGLLLAWRLTSPLGLMAIDWEGLLLAVSPLAIAAMAQTIPIIAGGQGLSAGATLVLVTAVVATWPMSGSDDALAAIAVGLSVGLAVGALNGVLIGFCGLRSTVTTVAVGAASMAYALQHIGEAYAPEAEVLHEMLLGPHAGGVSILPIATISCACFGGAIALRSRFGRALRLVGEGAPQANRAPLLFWAYVFAGGGAAVGGILLAGEFGSVNAALGAPVLLQILAAVALGGSAPGLRGGSVLGSLLGAAIVVLAGYLFVPFGIPDFLSNSIDASWLLIGLSLCVLLGRRRSTIPAFKASSEARSRSFADALARLAPILLLFFCLRPAASDLATLAAGIALLAVGQVAVIRAGTLDLSMPGLVSLSAIATVSLTQYSDAKLPLVLAGLLAGAIGVGVLQGWLADRLGRATICVTLATGGIAQTISAALLVLLPAGYSPPLLTAAATQRWLGVSPAAWLMSATAVAAVVLLDRNATRHLGFVVSAIASCVFGIATAALGGSVHFSLIDSYSLSALAAALLASGGIGWSSVSISSAIPLAYLVVLIDTALLSMNVGYSGRICALALLMIGGEGLRVAHRFLQSRSRPPHTPVEFPAQQ
jgi:ribose transport system permease protein